MRLKVPFLHGSQGRRCGRHKRGGQCALPGEVSGCAIKLARPKGWDDAAREVSRGHSNRSRSDEGLNRWETASGSFESVTGQKHCKVALIDDAGRNPTRIQSGVYRHDRNQTRKQVSTEPPDTWTVCPVVWEDGEVYPSPPTRFVAGVTRL